MTATSLRHQRAVQLGDAVAEVAAVVGRHGLADAAFGLRISCEDLLAAPPCATPPRWAPVGREDAEALARAALEVVLAASLALGPCGDVDAALELQRIASELHAVAEGLNGRIKR